MIDDSRPSERLFERLTGTVERVTFHNEENGFSVLKVRVRGRKDPVAVVGHVPTIAAGEKIDAGVKILGELLKAEIAALPAAA